MPRYHSNYLKSYIIVLAGVKKSGAWPFPLPVILPTGNLIKYLFHQLVTFPIFHSINWAFHQFIILLICHFINLSLNNLAIH
jgi:hypothetical protein